jgi:type IV pilus assembly protein PilX
MIAMPAAATDRRRIRRHQQGATLLIVLATLLILLAGGVALLRSSDANLLLTGQLATRRDMQNQGERGIAWAVAQFNSGGLSSKTSRESNQGSINYSAVQLASNSQGIPSILLSDTAYAASGMTGSDIESTNTSVTIRTVIDRLCTEEGASATDTCTMISKFCGGHSAGQDSSVGGGEVLKCDMTVYRITVRVDGPRSAQAFYQSIFAM